MNLVSRLVSAAVLVLTTTRALAAPQTTHISKPKKTPEAAARNEAAIRQALTVLLREANGQQLGSGVLVSQGPSGAWVATNRHVVAGQKKVCVVTSDRRSAAAMVLPVTNEGGRGPIDLALIWLPGDEKNTAPAAAMKEEPYIAQDLPLVVATGFPTPLSRPVDGPQYNENTGLLVPLLRSPLQDGLDLTYTASVEKGMSGGGVFLGSELIGINSAHREPLWPGKWRDGRGREIDEVLNEKLDLVSLGISAKQIKEAVTSAKQPSSVDLNALIGFACNPGQQDAKSVRSQSAERPGKGLT